MNIETFIAANLPVAPAPLVPEISLHQAVPTSGLHRLAQSRPPYWARCWPGGAALARFLLDAPDTASGRSVLDLGTGCGIAAIAAALSGASSVIASDIDPNAIAAAAMNARLNETRIELLQGDLSGGEPPACDLIVVADLFYERRLALRVERFLDRCLCAGMAVLVGDPGRDWLPLHRMEPVETYDVADVGGTTTGRAAVCRFLPQ